MADVAPLADIPPIERIVLPAQPENIAPLRCLHRLQFISIKCKTSHSQPDKNAAEFWKEFDAKPRE